MSQKKRNLILCIYAALFKGTNGHMLIYHLFCCLIPAGAVLYRIPLTWGQNKLPWKLLHAALMLLALILSIVGLCAVFDFHNVNKIPNLYSLHSWIGIAATALFAMQVRHFKWRNWSFYLIKVCDLIIRLCVVGGGDGRLPPALLSRVTA